MLKLPLTTVLNERINDLTAKNNECINEIGELKDKSLDIEEKVDSLKSGKFGILLS